MYWLISSHFYITAGILDPTCLSSYLPLCFCFHCADWASLKYSSLVYSWTLSRLALVLLCWSQNVSSVSSWSLQVWPFLTWIDCWHWPWPCCSWNCVPSVLQQFYGGGNSSRGFSLWLSAYYYRWYTFICLHAGMTAPGIFLFLQTKLLVFLLSIYFREIYFYLHLWKLCVQGCYSCCLCSSLCQLLTDAISTLPVTHSML